MFTEGLMSAQLAARDAIQQANRLFWERHAHDDDPFIVLTETKFSFRCIPVWIGTLLTGLGSKKKHM